MASTKISFSLILFLGCLTSSLAAEEGKKDQATFEKKLSPYARILFMRLSPDQKERAMDYADNSPISPDDAVAIAACECKRVKS
jgi:hypothetical protein